MVRWWGLVAGLVASWSSVADGGPRRRPAGRCSPRVEVVAEIEDGDSELAGGKDAVYWVEQGRAKEARAGGVTTHTLSLQTGVARVIPLGRHLCWLGYGGAFHCHGVGTGTADREIAPSSPVIAGSDSSLIYARKGTDEIAELVPGHRPRIVAVEQGGTAFMAVDGGYLYWLGKSRHRLKRTSLEDGALGGEELFVSQFPIDDFVVANGRGYFLSDGKVNVLEAHDGHWTTKLLAEILDTPSQLARCGDALCVPRARRDPDRYEIVRVSTTSGAVSPVVSRPGYVGRVVEAGSSLFWIEKSQPTDQAGRLVMGDFRCP